VPFDPVLIHAPNPGAMTGAGNNTYLVTGADGTAVLIDAGIGDTTHLDAVDAALARAGAHLTDVIVTHGHADHASGASALAARHPRAQFLKHPWPEFDDDYRVPWTRIDDADAIDSAGERLLVVHTPGHSPDHVALWHAPSRTAFTGDLVVAGSSVMIHTSRGGRLADYLQSLERVRALQPRVLLPAHGPRVDDPEALLTGYLRHRGERERQVVEALAAGHATVEAIAESIYHDLAPALMAAARENVRAHLEKLRDEGRATVERDRWRM
jgi:glyoxylase-like metal-dependent hydrolase (beta-lactamase superfamily II)